MVYVYVEILYGGHCYSEINVSNHCGLYSGHCIWY